MRGSLHLRNDFAAWLIDFLCKSLKQDWKTSKYTAKVILKLSWFKRIFVISSSTLSLVAILSLNFKIINLITSINPGIGFFTTHRETFLLTYVWSVWEKYLFFSQIKFVNLEWTMHICSFVVIEANFNVTDCWVRMKTVILTATSKKIVWWGIWNNVTFTILRNVFLQSLSCPIYELYVLVSRNYYAMTGKYYAMAGK